MFQCLDKFIDSGIVMDSKEKDIVLDPIKIDRIQLAIKSIETLVKVAERLYQTYYDKLVTKPAR